MTTEYNVLPDHLETGVNVERGTIAIFQEGEDQNSQDVVTIPIEYWHQFVESVEKAIMGTLQ